MEAYERMLAAFGPQHWWPGDSPFEIMVGAVLVQNTAWRNVERAIDNLREAGVMEPHALYQLAAGGTGRADPPGRLLPSENQAAAKSAAIRCRTIRRLARRHVQHQLVDSLREQLLAINGIGPETADAILLYAGGLPTFVVDTYTHRILARHGWIDYDASYHDIKDYFESTLPADAALYNEYHALLVRVGKDYCKRTAPKCEACPLADMLPASGIVMPF